VRNVAFEVLQENGVHRGEDIKAILDACVGRLVTLGQAVSDPIRVRMLGMMAEGRVCCLLPDCGVAAEYYGTGICVCEFECYLGMGQSKVSYHLGKLRSAGLVREEKCGKWTFYSLDQEAVGDLLNGAATLLLTDTADRRESDCC
jgi:ArsR family transcriptional regulator, arsenate/arsenite/antimonite-responsive transcriptional repressor